MVVDKQIDDVIYECIRFGRQNVNALDSHGKVVKLMEEVGELAEAVLVHTDAIVHKKNVGTVIEEASDAIQCIVDIVQDAYGESSAPMLVEALANMLDKKLAKWKDVCGYSDQ